jgi:phage FluMu protein Com
MLNPGYKVVAKKEKMQCDPGQAFACPFCKATILEADAVRFRVKCPHCRHWVYAERIDEEKFINIAHKK